MTVMAPYDQEDDEPAYYVVTEADDVIARYEARVRLLHIFAAAVAITILAVVMVLLVYWVRAGVLPYNDPAPPTTRP